MKTGTWALFPEPNIWVAQHLNPLSQEIRVGCKKDGFL